MWRRPVRQVTRRIRTAPFMMRCRVMSWMRVGVMIGLGAVALSTVQAVGQVHRAYDISRCAVLALLGAVQSMYVGR